MTIDDVCSQLEEAWDDDGFLGQLRGGIFDPESSTAFLQLLRKIHIEGSSLLPARMLSLIWYIPLFLQWQEQRVGDNGFDSVTYQKFVTTVINTLEEVVGVP